MAAGIAAALIESRAANLRRDSVGKFFSNVGCERNARTAGLALLWQNLAIDWRNWIPESDFQ
jgi:hypothetical protein